MSAFVVDKAHIRYLVSAAMHPKILGPSRHCFTWYTGERGSLDMHELGCGDFERASEVGQMLYEECIKSVSYRYNEENPSQLPGKISDLAEPWYGKHEGWGAYLKPEIDPVQVLKACDCYVYQSCEHPGWETSEAKEFIEALRSAAWHALPEYDAAAWEINDHVIVDTMAALRR